MSTFVALLTVVIVLGSIGNIISIIIWRHGKRSKSSSCGKYMWSLALNDLFILLVLGTEFALFRSDILLRYQHDVLCIFLIFTGLVSPQVSAWITVVIAVERMLYVRFPIKMYQSNVKRRSSIVLCIIILFSTVLNIAVLVVPNIVVYPDSFDFCVKTEFLEEYEIMYMISYGIFTFSFPLILLTISNCVTLITMCSRGRNLARHSQSQQRNVRNITKIVICISVLHCISTLPYAILQYGYYIDVSITQFKHAEYVSITYFFNSGFNFVLYSLFGKDFRQDLIELFNILVDRCRSLCTCKFMRNCQSEQAPRALYVSESAPAGAICNTNRAASVNCHTDQTASTIHHTELSANVVCHIETSQRVVGRCSEPVAGTSCHTQEEVTVNSICLSELKHQSHLMQYVALNNQKVCTSVRELNEFCSTENTVCCLNEDGSMETQRSENL